MAELSQSVPVLTEGFDLRSRGGSKREMQVGCPQCNDYTVSMPSFKDEFNDQQTAPVARLCDQAIWPWRNNCDG